MLKTISDRLFNLGIPANLVGYKYLRWCIQYAVEHPEAIQHITKELYPECAKHYNSTPARVERAMRHAIEVGCDNSTALIEYFGRAVSASKYKPTNSELIAKIADDIELELTIAV